jgi:hypothetical protein
MPLAQPPPTPLNGMQGDNGAWHVLESLMGLDFWGIYLHVIGE